VQDILDFSRKDFNKAFSLSPKKDITIKTKWDLVKIKQLINEQQKSKIQVGKANNEQNNEYLFFTSGAKVLTYSQYLIDGENIYLSTGGNAIVKYFDGKASYSTDTYAIKSIDEDIILTKFMFFVLYSMTNIINEFYFKGAGLKHLQKPEFKEIKIPVPPKDIQQQIVTECEAIDKEVEQAQKNIVDAKIEINKLMENIQGNLESLNNLMSITRGSSPRPIRSFLTENENGVNWIKIGDVSSESKYVTKTLQKITIDGSKKSRIVKIGDFILSNSMSYGRPYILKIDGCVHDGWLILSQINQKLDKDYLYNVLSSKMVQEQFSGLATGTTVDNLNIPRVQSVKIPIPPLSEQKTLVGKIEKLENKINQAQDKLKSAPVKKQSILDKYL
jgi:restriction endonuclease S subunit